MKKSIKSSTTSEIFVDTSGFFAMVVTEDDMHAKSVELLGRGMDDGQRFVTSDYVLDETASLLRARGQGQLLHPWFEMVHSSKALRIEWMDVDRFGKTRQMFLRHHDKGWSFTDCFSFHLMHVLRLTDALTKDKHFHQAGFNALLM
jgi:predicted nucleic acid-binding protein